MSHGRRHLNDHRSLLPLPLLPLLPLPSSSPHSPSHILNTPASTTTPTPSEELSGMLDALEGGWVAPEAGGDLLRDGPGVLPTGRCE